MLLRIAYGRKLHDLQGKSRAEVDNIFHSRPGDQPLSLDFVQLHGPIEDWCQSSDDAQSMVGLPWLLEKVIKLKDAEAEEERRELQQQLEDAGKRAKAGQRLAVAEAEEKDSDVRLWEAKNKQLRERLEKAERDRKSVV